MGVVYKAYQTKLKRQVALKMILAGAHAGKHELHRFHREAVAVAQLQHRHIVQIYESGEASGLPFFSLEFVEGGSLADRLDGTPWDQRKAASLVYRLAGAVHYAHEQGIVHRDLKPANVLLTEEDLPKITDFGLAKRTEGHSTVTRDGAIMGTPSYMAPEQASGRTRDINARTDVYALGAILYELLTGRPPFKAATTSDTLAQVQSQPPPPLSMLNPNIDPDLETICLKCLEKDPKDRYATAAEMAKNLECFLTGRPIPTRRLSLFQRALRSLRYRQKVVRAWSAICWQTGTVMGLVSALAYWIIQTAQPREAIILLGAGQLAVTLLIFLRHLGPRRYTLDFLEMHTSTVWAAYAVTLVLFCRFPPPGADVTHHRLSVYPNFAVATGFAYCSLGLYWTGFFAIGTAFFALSLVMPLRLEWAPLEFGLLFWVCSVGFAVYLSRLARAAEASAEVQQIEEILPTRPSPG
jgi:hypothetical protein